MTPQQTALVKKTWRELSGIQPATLGDLFYTKLFTDHPSLRKMFPSNMQEQNQKLIDMLHAIIIRLDKLDELTDEIAAMAQRHEGYGVRPAHYRFVGSALLWTLKKGIGDHWTREIEEAWTCCYNMLAETMIQHGSSMARTS